MPIFPRSPASSIHSWSLVYLNPAGYAIGAPVAGPKGPALLLPLVERHRDDAGARLASADIDVEFGAGRRVRGWKIRHADRLLQERRLRAACYGSGLRVADVYIVAV